MVFCLCVFVAFPKVFGDVIAVAAERLFEGTIRVLATHDFLEIKNARFEVLLELDSFDDADLLPSDDNDVDMRNDVDSDLDDADDSEDDDATTFVVESKRKQSVLHLSSRLVQQYHLVSGDRVSLRGRLLNRSQMDDARVPFRHTYVHRYLNVTQFNVSAKCRFRSRDFVFLSPFLSE